jgi:hypothetical protein
VATIAGLLILLLLNGVVIAETVFNSGMGKAASDAAVQLDVITVWDWSCSTGLSWSCQPDRRHNVCLSRSAIRLD